MGMNSNFCLKVIFNIDILNIINYHHKDEETTSKSE